MKPGIGGEIVGGGVGAGAHGCPRRGRRGGCWRKVGDDRWGRAGIEREGRERSGLAVALAGSAQEGKGGKGVGRRPKSGRANFLFF